MPRISVSVKTGKKGTSRLEALPSGSYVAFLHEKAHDGEANRALLDLLAKQLKVPKTSLKIRSGAHSHQKIIEY